jgi:ADP-heptose:LPS heptosyltransferase
MNITAKPLKNDYLPRRILAIRLQAMGDLVITLPYLQSLREQLPPSVKLDLLTRKEVDSIPRNLHLFDKIYSIGGGRRFKLQLGLSFLLLPAILLRRYDVVLDLQNNLISRIVRKSVRPGAWSQFDKVSGFPAGERTRLTIEAAGFKNIDAYSKFSLKSSLSVDHILKQNGWDGKSDLVILNPAGAFSTRNWPMDSYLNFARIWLNHFPDTQFLMIGVNLISQKAGFLKSKLENRLINLVNKTTPAQAFAIIQKTKFVLSEDSGLMHMAWVSGIPTLAMFGSTRSDWSTPLGKHTWLLHSSDLECGSCMRATCKYGDTRCLTRYTPELVFEKALTLVHQGIQ